MGSFYLLHASLTEYVLIFGTAVETSGHSGMCVQLYCKYKCKMDYFIDLKSRLVQNDEKDREFEDHMLCDQECVLKQVFPNPKINYG